MYENGRKVSRYHRQRKHKQRVKDHFASQYRYGAYTGMTYPEFCASLTDEELEYSYGPVRPIPNAIQYWRVFYLTGPRQYAKDATNSVIRAHWREKLNDFYRLDEEDWDDFDPEMEQHNGYQKHFDYAWTIW